MSDIKINDLALLKFGYASLSDQSPVDLKDKFPADEYVCFGQYHDDGEPFWSCIMHSFKEKHDCLIDIAINKRGLLTPKTFDRIASVVFDYVFNQSDLVRCTAEVRKSNEASMNLVVKWGFELEGIKRKGYSTPNIEDMYIFGLLKENCQWV